MLDIERKWEKMVSEREVWGQISKSPIYCVKDQDLHQCSSNFTEHRNHAGVFLNADFDSVGLWWTLRFRISNKLSGDVNAAGLRFHLKKKGTKKQEACRGVYINQWFSNCAPHIFHLLC